MNAIIDWIKILPTSIQIAVASIIIGATAVYAHETRYMTVSDFTKSYILDLKQAIREIVRTLESEDLSERERAMLENDLEALLDELCYEAPEDRLCAMLED